MATAKKVVERDGTVHIICILDRSGSMGSLASDVIGGFNQFLKEQKELDGDAILSLILFDDRYDLIYNRVPLGDVKELTADVYSVRGMTALNDAIGKTINSNSDDNAIVFINTDGLENSSREYTTDNARRLVEEKQNDGWEFLFAGVGIDAFNQGGKNYGMSLTSTGTFDRSSAGMVSSYSHASSVTSNYRSSVAMKDSSDGDE